MKLAAGTYGCNYGIGNDMVRSQRLASVVKDMRTSTDSSARDAERDRRMARKGVEELRAKR